MVKVDLHLHTTYSDGSLAPSELVQLCARRGLEVVAITDHDSTEGLPEAMEAADGLPGLTLVPGIELSTDVPRSEIHLLGYFVDTQDPLFQSSLQGMRDRRIERAREVVQKLASLGVGVSWERVKELSGGGAIGRPHIAQAMVEAGYVKYPRDAFTEYLGRNGSAYVERMKLSPVDAVGILVRNGALAAMAHPTFSMAGSGPEDVAKLKGTLAELKDAGLIGMEVYYGGYTSEQVEMLAGIADEMGLVPCGGSDYHASGNPGEPEPGSAGPPMESLNALLALKGRFAADAPR